MNSSTSGSVSLSGNGSATGSSSGPAGGSVGVMMSGLRVGLRIGESFAEAAAIRGALVTQQKRWYLPKQTLADGLKALLSALPPDVVQAPGNQLWISTTRALQILARKQGETPIFLTTSGFEAKLVSEAGQSTAAFASRPEREWIPLDLRRTFGVSERIDSAGNILQALKLEDLEEIAAKLSLLKVKSIAIGFLNSAKNAEHEKQAAQFFSEKGFHVVTSSDFAAPFGESHESQRWIAALEEAFSAQPLREDLKGLDQSLREVLGDHHANWDIQIWTGSGLQSFDCESRELNLQSLRGGHHASLEKWAQSSPQTVVLNLGLEGFSAFGVGADAKLAAGAPLTGMVVGLGDTSALPRRSLELPVQATNTVEIGDWSAPRFSEAEKGFEPGPMIFGKAHHLTPMDLLSICGHLKVSADISEMIQERSTGRILEALYTFGKMIPAEHDKDSVDAREVAESLVSSWIETIAVTLSRLTPKSVRVTGALAASILPLLAKRRPDWVFAIGAEVDQAEAMAAALAAMPPATSATAARMIAPPMMEAAGSGRATAGAPRGAKSTSSTAAKSPSRGGMPPVKSGAQTATKTVVKTVTRGGGAK